MAEQATTIILQARPIDALAKHYNAPKGGIFNYSPEYDGSGFRYEPWIENNGNPPGESHIYCRKVDQAGNEAGRWEFTLPQGWKPDDVSNPTATLQAGQTLADVVFGVSGHYNILDAQGNAIARDTKPFLCVIPAVWVPRPGEMGVVHNGPNGFVEGASTGGGDVDYAQIQRMLDAARAATVHDIDQMFGSADLRTDIRELDADVFVRLVDPSRYQTDAKARAFQDGLRALYEGMFKNGQQGGSSIVYQQLVNTSYTGALGAIHDSGHAQGQTTQQGQGEPSK